MWTAHLSDAHRRDVVNVPVGWEIPYSWDFLRRLCNLGLARRILRSKEKQAGAELGLSPGWDS